MANVEGLGDLKAKVSRPLDLELSEWWVGSFHTYIYSDLFFCILFLSLPANGSCSAAILCFSN